MTRKTETKEKKQTTIYDRMLCALCGSFIGGPLTLIVVLLIGGVSISSLINCVYGGLIIGAVLGACHPRVVEPLAWIFSIVWP